MSTIEAPADWREDPVTMAAVNLIELAHMHDRCALRAPLSLINYHREAAIRCRSDAREMMERARGGHG